MVRYIRWKLRHHDSKSSVIDEILKNTMVTFTSDVVDGKRILCIDGCRWFVLMQIQIQYRIAMLAIRGIKKALLTLYGWFCFTCLLFDRSVGRAFIIYKMSHRRVIGGSFAREFFSPSVNEYNLIIFVYIIGVDISTTINLSSWTNEVKGRMIWFILCTFQLRNVRSIRSRTVELTLEAIYVLISASSLVAASNWIKMTRYEHVAPNI